MKWLLNNFSPQVFTYNLKGHAVPLTLDKLSGL